MFLFAQLGIKLDPKKMLQRKKWEPRCEKEKVAVAISLFFLSQGRSPTLAAESAELGTKTTKSKEPVSCGVLTSLRHQNTSASQVSKNGLRFFFCDTTQTRCFKCSEHEKVGQFRTRYLQMLFLGYNIPSPHSTKPS